MNSPQEHFVFFPNALVTKDMFSYLIDMNKNYLVIGSLGSSKTVSVIAFQKLSDYVINYLYNSGDIKLK